MFDRLGMRQHQGALAEIVQEERRQDEEQPCALDRLSAEVAQIRIKRLAAGHDQEHRAERHQTDRAVRREKLDPVPGIERGQHARIVADMRKAEHGKRQEPDDHHRPEGGGDHRRAAALHREQADQDHHGQRNDVILQRRRCELEAFHRRQHRDGRRDHRVADEHRRADDAEHEQRQGAAGRARGGPAPSATANRPRRCCRPAAAAAHILRSRRPTATRRAATARRARCRASPARHEKRRERPRGTHTEATCRCRHRPRRCCRPSARRSSHGREARQERRQGCH